MLKNPRIQQVDPSLFIFLIEVPQLTRRDALDLGKSIYWSDKVVIRIEGVSYSYLTRSG